MQDPKDVRWCANCGHQEIKHNPECQAYSCKQSEKCKKFRLDKRAIKKYSVTLDIFLMETIDGVEARNKKEAFEKAIEMSHYNDGATEFTLFEVVEDK